MTIYYWNGATGDASLVQNESILKAARQLLNGDYNPNDLEKLNNPSGQPIYSFRLTGAERLLFTTLKGAILLLEHLPTHDYLGSRFLKKGVLKAYVQKNEEALFRALNPEEHPVFKDQQSGVQDKPVDYFNQQFITLSTEQGHAATTPLPAVINGAAGSGKSYVALSSLAQFLEQNEDTSRLLYVTKNHRLTHEMKQTWQDFSPEGKEEAVEFKTYNEVIATTVSTVGQETFEAWLETYPQNSALDLLTPEEIYLEFKRASVLYEVDTQPLKLDESQLLALRALHQDYQRYLKATDAIDCVFLTLITQDDFKVYWEALGKTAELHPLTAKQIYQEFRICSGFSQDNYNQLGNRESSVPKGPLRQAIYEAYQRYVTYLNHENTFNPDFISLNQLDKNPALYHLIVVDEAQNLSPLALNQLSYLTSREAILYCMDAHQNLADAQPIRPLLKKIFYDKNITLNNITLNKTYRCPENIAHVINATIQLKHALTGGKIDSYEVSGMNEDESLGSSTVDLITPGTLKKQEWFHTRERDTHFIVVTSEAHIEEARARFNTPLVFTPEQVQGLEYHTVVIYKLFNSDEAKKALKTANAQLDSATATKTHRAKAGDADNTHVTWVHQIYTAYTRAQNTLYIIEENTRINQPFLAHLQEAVDLSITKPSAEKKSEALPQALPETNWAKEEEKQRLEGNHNIADDIRRRYLTPHEVTPIQAIPEARPAPEVHAVAALDITSLAESKNKATDDRFSGSTSDENAPRKKSTGKSKKKSTKTSPPKQIEPAREQAIVFDKRLGKQLLDAVERNQIKEVSKLLKHKKCNPNQTNDNGLTALMFASQEEGHSDTVEKLLRDERVDPNLANIDGRTALMFASHQGHSDTVEKLLRDERVDPNLANVDGRTALMFASHEGHSEAVKKLLKHKKCNPNQTSNNSFTALMFASQEGHSDAVEKLLHDERINPDQTNNGGYTALMFASHQGHSEAVEKLLHDERINPDQTSNGGLTALMLASQEGHSEAVKKLLKHKKCNPNQTNNNSFTALVYASHQGHFNLVNILLDNESILNYTLRSIIDPIQAWWPQKLKDKPLILVQFVSHASQIWEHLKSPEKMDLTPEQHMTLLQDILEPSAEHPLRNILFRQKSNGDFFKSESSLIFEEMKALIHPSISHVIGASEDNVKASNTNASMST
ncbi:MAG: ankyrin repeat domain-containing protein [Gammaproteobacteria bacterium]|nr:ankyrin repeat domain-containing protein [Gammaproteobacteria bacterium]